VHPHLPSTMMIAVAITVASDGSKCEEGRPVDKGE
jgi:hypothetical protein